MGRESLLVDFFLHTRLVFFLKGPRQGFFHPGQIVEWLHKIIVSTRSNDLEGEIDFIAGGNRDDGRCFIEPAELGKRDQLFLVEGFDIEEYEVEPFFLDFFVTL